MVPLLSRNSGLQRPANRGKSHCCYKSQALAAHDTQSLAVSCIHARQCAAYHTYAACQRRNASRASSEHCLLPHVQHKLKGTSSQDAKIQDKTGNMTYQDGHHSKTSILDLFDLELSESLWVIC